METQIDSELKEENEWQNLSRQQSNASSSITPTFDDFVSLLIEQRTEIDTNWATLCQRNFDMNSLIVSTVSSYVYEKNNLSGFHLVSVHPERGVFGVDVTTVGIRDEDPTVPSDISVCTFEPSTWKIFRSNAPHTNSFSLKNLIGEKTSLCAR